MGNSGCTTITSGGPTPPNNTVTRETTVTDSTTMISQAVENVTETLVIPYPPQSRFSICPSNDVIDSQSSIEDGKCLHSEKSFYICDDYRIVSQSSGKFQISWNGQRIDASFDMVFASRRGKSLIWSFSKKRFFTLLIAWLWRSRRRGVLIIPLHMKERSRCTGFRTFDIIGSCLHHISMSEGDLRETWAGRQFLYQYDKEVVDLYI